MQQVHDWLAKDPDPKTRQELKQLLDNHQQQELESRFSSRLAFGTAGLRGKVGAGPNRMNRLVIQETAAGLGQHLLNHFSDAKERGVVIGYDGRPDSKQFAEDTALVLAALGIKSYLTHDVAATPIVAFGVRHLNTVAAVVVTASHNPPEYNGFKVYWDNGAQIIPPQDAHIAEQIDIAATKPIPLLSKADAEAKHLLQWLKADYYQAYRDALNDSALLNHHSNPKGISLSYSAMHGVGANMAETLLTDAGFDKVYSVPEQRDPDGSFPTVNFPNPEEAGAMDMVMALAKQHDATLACANDPDADRFAVAARTESGDYKMLTGDQVGSLFGHYLLSKTDASKQLVGNTIVSSTLLSKIAAAHGAHYYQTLTGFKWLTNVAMQKQTAEAQFLFAYEEALGYTIGTTVWDKDGLSAQVVFAQLTAELAAEGKTIWDQLESLYRQHGIHLNAQRSIALDPSAPAIGAQLRQSPPTTIAGKAIDSVADLAEGTLTHSDGQVDNIDLPASDVLIYHLEGGSRVIIRPSGTEPKVKCYYEVIEPIAQGEAYQQAETRAQQAMERFITDHQASLK